MIGFPLGTGLGATALRATAASAHRTAEDAERIRTSETVATALHDRRQERFANLYHSAVPLLRGLAERTLDPQDEHVQRACAIEAARMRRLFAETDTVDDPLRHELFHCADVADRRGVLVDIDARGTVLPLPVPVRRALTDAPLAALATARTWARITVVGTDCTVSVSVVADCGPTAVPDVDDTLVALEMVHDDDVLWVEARWPNSPSLPS